MANADLLLAACRIGDAICAQAYWAAHRCTWVAHDPEAPAAGLAALSGELYRGTAGVGLFLGLLARASGTSEHARAARGALRQSLRHWKGPAEPREALALHDGWGGAAVAALTAARAMNDQALLQLAGEALARTAPLAFGAGDAFDFVSGRAGAILALLEAHRLTGDPTFLDSAIRLGSEIASLADADDDGARWPTAKSFGVETVHPLTGLAHGASGPGVALLSLAKATGDDALRSLARRAFAYESRAFDTTAGNWPDYRAFGGRDAYVPSYARAWCHGAPGIGVARVAALALDVDAGPDVTRDLRAALTTTRAALLTAHAEPEADLSLCHGTAGLLLCTHEMAASLGDSEAAADVQAVAAAIARSILNGDQACRDAVLDSADATLMTGAAGLGYALLRLGTELPASPLLLM